MSTMMDWIAGPTPIPMNGSRRPSFTKLKQSLFQRLFFRGGYYKYIPATGVSFAEIVSWLSKNMPHVYYIMDDWLGTLRIKFHDDAEVMAFKLVWVY